MDGWIKSILKAFLALFQDISRSHFFFFWMMEPLSERNQDLTEGAEKNRMQQNIGKRGRNQLAFPLDHLQNFFNSDACTSCESVTTSNLPAAARSCVRVTAGILCSSC